MSPVEQITTMKYETWKNEGKNETELLLFNIYFLVPRYAFQLTAAFWENKQISHRGLTRTTDYSG